MSEPELPSAPKVPLPPLDDVASALAPFIYADVASTAGFHQGVGNVTLEAVRHMIDSEGTGTASRVVVAHVRLPISAVLSLRNALDGILLQATPAASEAAN